MLEFKRIDKTKEEIEKLNNITKIISFIRFIVAVTSIIFIIIGISYKSLYLFIGIGIFVIFALLLILTNKYYKKLEVLKNIIKAYDNHKKRRENKYHLFKDNGNDLKSKNNYKESDLDLFGPHSIYQYLSVAKTKYGRKYLHDALVDGSDYDYKELSQKLAENEDSIYLEGAIYNFNDDAKKMDYDSLYSLIGNKIIFNILFILPLISFILMIVYIPFIFIKGFNPYFLFIFVIVNYFLTKLCLNNPIFNLDSHIYYDVCEKYLDLSTTINNINIDTNIYNNIKNTINDKKENLKNVISSLNLLSYRKNMLFNFLSNSIFIFDFWTIIIYNLKTKKNIEIKDYFEAVGRLEVALSFANIGIDNEIYTIGQENESIDAKDMYHVLVKNCIPNSFNLNGGVVLTGSNMSGKTTFMRTLGICQTLFNANALIPAKEFKSSKINIYTSLRANDMLSEGISTFYAEILRVKEMNDAIKNNKNLLVIDEIFKGTNAIDRIEASFKVIDKFNSYYQYFIVSTHDFELCDAKNILNYHFNEEYNDDKISFDYKIKIGKSDTKNAIYLLKMANIID